MALPDGVSAVFPFAPDWSDPVQESFAYKTNVLRSRDMTGQWRGLRSKPREQLNYTILLGADDAASFDYRFGRLQPYTWMLPQWSRRRFLASAATIGTNTLLLDGPVSYLARAGDEYILMLGDVEPEVVAIESISGDRLTLTLTSALDSSWPSRAKVYPAWRAQVAGEMEAEWISSHVMRCPVSFRRLVDNRAPEASSLTADETLNSLEVLVRPVDWSKPINVTYDWVPDYIDAEVGPFESVVRGLISRRLRKGEVLCESRDEVDWWLAFLDRRSGQRVPFMMPTWLGDLQLQQPLSAGIDFEVAGTDLGMFSPSSGTYTHLMIRKKNGSVAFFEVSTIAADFGLGVSTVTTVEDWDESYGPWECSQISFVTVCHLASDGFTVSWITDEVARINLAVMTEEIPE
ncbi:hypothetical protein Q7C_846 [Methylophaga frappieri]|uniref:Uncharacterized protein n=1 Tax=Methylophaga frappieri (strain ATCC BAA-2434 / DSM 25690 / JAM7) TaxID=754477 RepID=I1YGH2_METFJ|nr:hypothetical protein [Methylophaga frappieri]AFJ02015.1 hypothetical protein Q7C_846 [Methylophaga frappieri]